MLSSFLENNVDSKTSNNIIMTGIMTSLLMLERACGEIMVWKR